MLFREILSNFHSAYYTGLAVLKKRKAKREVKLTHSGTVPQFTVLHHAVSAIRSHYVLPNDRMDKKTA
jgi:hypothetical protein